VLRLWGDICGRSSSVKPDNLAALGFSRHYTAVQAVEHAVSEIAREVLGTS